MFAKWDLASENFAKRTERRQNKYQDSQGIKYQLNNILQFELSYLCQQEQLNRDMRRWKPFLNFYFSWQQTTSCYLSKTYKIIAYGFLENYTFYFQTRDLMP